MGWAALHWRNLVVCAAPLDWILNRPTINSLNFFHEYVSRILSRQSAANSFGALGAFMGSYLLGFLHAVTGDERASYILMSLSLVCSALLILSFARLRSMLEHDEILSFL